MRFLLLALALFGVAFYVSNPQVFGTKGHFQISTNGRVERNQTGASTIDFGNLGDLGAKLFAKITRNSAESPAQTQLASTAPEGARQPISGDASILSAIQAPDLSSYNGQLTAIATAMQNAPEATTAEMRAATTACMDPKTPPVLTTYFVGLVQLVAETAQLPKSSQAAQFKAKIAPLSSLLQAWLGSLSATDRASATQNLQYWASRSSELVACHLPWLNKG